MKRFVLVVSLCLLSTSSIGSYSGNELLEALEKCTYRGNAVQSNYDCGISIGFIEGVAQTSQSYQDLVDHFRRLKQIRARESETDREEVEQLFCIPENIPQTQSADVVKNYLKENASTRHLGAGFLVLFAFREAWPCTKE